jgi:hypothetical protein
MRSRKNILWPRPSLFVVLISEITAQLAALNKSKVLALSLIRGKFAKKSINSSARKFSIDRELDPSAASTISKPYAGRKPAIHHARRMAPEARAKTPPIHGVWLEARPP